MACCMRRCWQTTKAMRSTVLVGPIGPPPSRSSDTGCMLASSGRDGVDYATAIDHCGNSRAGSIVKGGLEKGECGGHGDEYQGFGCPHGG
jgi:hypothetical protein